MQSSTPQVSPSRPARARRRMMRCVRGAAGLAAMATFLAIAQQAPPANPVALNQAPDKSQAMQANQQQVKAASYEPAELERRKQIADDAAKLLQLAKELKIAVDRTDKDTLSVKVIRKAESIEKLAKGVKEKAKLSTGAS